MKYIIDLEAAVESHTGLIRDKNEDNFYFNGEFMNVGETSNVCRKFSKKGENFLFAVCDGIGGQNSGEKASHYAVKSLELLQRLKNPDYETINKIIIALNDKIYLKAADIEDRGMGTTLAALQISNGKFMAINVGDSRVYHYRGSQFERLTQDHTEAQRLINLGIIDEVEAKNNKGRYMLSRYLGMPPEDGEVSPDISQNIEVKAGDRFLISSDGLTDMVSEDVALEIMDKANCAAECAKSLVDKAISSGGRDNVTVIVLIIKSIQIQ